jgi:hypothetical protein
MKGDVLENSGIEKERAEPVLAYFKLFFRDS